MSYLLTIAALPCMSSTTASHQHKVVATTAQSPPGKLGRWVNRRTRPVGKVLEKLTPFQFVKKPKRFSHCCFPADTRITLPGGATCAISALHVGQEVLGWNPKTDALDTVQVEALATVVHDSLRQLSFADGRIVTATADHPFWVNNAGWASLAPALTTARYTTGPVRLLHPGDSCLVFNDAARLAPMQLREVTVLTTCGIATYTITRLSRGNLFFANGIAAGVEDAKNRNNRPSAFRLAMLRYKK